MLGGLPIPHGETIATYPTYDGAQKTVSRLVESEVPAKDIQIIGKGLRSIETITGRLGYAAAARSGAINGILLGLLFSAIFVLGNPNAAIQLFIGVMFMGIAFGMLMSIISYSILRRRRDYTSVTQVVADSYEVAVLPRSIQRARQILAAPVAAPTPVPAAATAAPVAPPVAPPTPASDLTEPPRYGERITPTPEAAPAGDEESR